MKKDDTNYWLIKSEASCYSIDDFKRDKIAVWTDVRNFQARNFLRAMKKNDTCVFYHSGQTPPCAVGIGRVVKCAYPDPTQFDSNNEYYDNRATFEKPIWDSVNIKFQKKFSKMISISEMRLDKVLQNMVILLPGNRLSVTPLTKREGLRIIELGS